jgi:cobyrinic acid a,c-diamide synthase
VVLGFETFDPELTIAAVIANRVGGDAHARGIREAIAARCRARVVGALAYDQQVTLTERHLGLVTAGEGGLTDDKRTQLADLIERSVDLDRLLELAVPVRVPTQDAAAGAPRAPRVRIGVAHDAAFCFYYRDNLALLMAAGAELVYWSPLTDGALPVVDGLYLGGGYPELHAPALAANKAVRNAVRGFADEGRPIYAECGGLMYLAEALEDVDGTTHPMVGLLPATVRMRPRRLSLSYTEVTLRADSPLGPSGTVARGHEALDDLRRFGIGNPRGETGAGVDRLMHGRVQSRSAARSARGRPDAWIGKLGLVHRSSILARRCLHARIATQACPGLRRCASRSSI